MKNSHARKTTPILSAALVVVALMVGATVAMAQDVQTITYYDNAVPGYDAKVRIVNPTGADLYAAIYVGDPNQELVECCSCLVSSSSPTTSGLRTLSVNVDLTTNPANGQFKSSGTITVIGTTTNTAGTGIAPAPGLKTFATHNQFFGPGLVQTETNGQTAPLTAIELAELTTTCQGFINLSGTGICSCGNGDNPVRKH